MKRDGENKSLQTQFHLQIIQILHLTIYEVRQKCICKEEKCKPKRYRTFGDILQTLKSDLIKRNKKCLS